ncbi:MAG: hypothetical protein IT289_05555 [Oligoflexia bacterium]|nr:hypothetical protein [Oligoflexia bacterium]
MIPVPTPTTNNYLKRTKWPQMRGDEDVTTQVYTNVEEGLSTVQIAKRFQVSRMTIASRLRAMGILVDQSYQLRSKNPENYRISNPPYGYSVQDGKLILNKKELKICRFIVEHIRFAVFQHQMSYILN